MGWLPMLSSTAPQCRETASTRTTLQCCFPMGKECVILVLHAVELLGQWPKQVRICLFALIDKPEGGLRGIGLYPGLRRIWIRVRKGCCQTWAGLNKRPYFAAAAGTSAEDVVWRQAVRAESPVLSKRFFCQLLWDMRKYFDAIGWSSLEAAAESYAIPKYILRATVAGYQFQRRFKFTIMVAQSIWAGCGVVPSCGNAAVMVQLHLTGPFLTSWWYA